jgi:hypothetical protein
MHILGPHCRNPIEVVKLTLCEQFTCPSCGSRFCASNVRVHEVDPTDSVPFWVGAFAGHRSAGAPSSARWRWLVPLALLLLLHPRSTHAAPQSMSLTQSAQTVEAYDFLEVALKVDAPDAKNPFTDVQVEGELGLRGADKPLPVTGFCAAADGSLFRVRFLPRRPGDYTYAVTYRQGTFSQRLTGQFQAVQGKRRGLLRVDPAHPFHFQWEGTGEHCYLNGTTAFLLMGWEDEKVIEKALDRFARYKVNRVRVLLTGRTDSFWSEPVRSGKGFRALLNPWPAERPDDVANPGFDYTRFHLPHWEKFERMLRYARDKDINISVILDWNDTKEHTAPGSEDERRYYRYAAARLGAFANVTWDLGDDLDSFRDEAWTRAAGTYLPDERGPVSSSGHKSSGQECAPGPHGGMVRHDVFPAMVSAPARLDAAAAASPGEDGAYHPPAERGIRLRGPLPAVEHDGPRPRLLRRRQPPRCLGNGPGRHLSNDG